MSRSRYVITDDADRIVLFGVMSPADETAHAAALQSGWTLRLLPEDAPDHVTDETHYWDGAALAALSDFGVSAEVEVSDPDDWVPTLPEGTVATVAGASGITEMAVGAGETTITLARSVGDALVRLECDGYKPSEVVVRFVE